MQHIDHLDTLEVIKLVDELLDDGVSSFAISPSDEEEIRGVFQIPKSYSRQVSKHVFAKK